MTTDDRPADPTPNPNPKPQESAMSQPEPTEVRTDQDQTQVVEPDQTQVVEPDPTQVVEPDQTQVVEAEPTLAVERTLTPPPAVPEPTGARGPSVPTVVWGLVFGLFAAAIMTAQVSDVDLNLDVTAPAALLLAGVVLVVWGIAGLGRSRRRTT